MAAKYPRLTSAHSVGMGARRIAPCRVLFVPEAGATGVPRGVAGTGSSQPPSRREDSRRGRESGRERPRVCREVAYRGTTSRDRSGWLKTEIDPRQVGERPKEQPCADEEHHRQRHLDDNERAPDSMMTPIGGRGPRTLAHRSVGIGLAGLRAGTNPKTRAVAIDTATVKNRLSTSRRTWPGTSAVSAPAARVVRARVAE